MRRSPGSRPTSARLRRLTSRPETREGADRTMDTVRLGIVGLGWFGGVLTAAARATGEAEVVSCFSRSDETRRGVRGHAWVRTGREPRRPPGGSGDRRGHPRDPALDARRPDRTDGGCGQARLRREAAGPQRRRGTSCDRCHRTSGRDAAGGHNRRRQPANRRIKVDGRVGRAGHRVAARGVPFVAGRAQPRSGCPGASIPRSVRPEA